MVGAKDPVAFTSRYDSWRYLGEVDVAADSDALSSTCDLRVPLTFDVADCEVIASIIAEEAQKRCQQDRTAAARSSQNGLFSLRAPALWLAASSSTRFALICRELNQGGRRAQSSSPP